MAATKQLILILFLMGASCPLFAQDSVIKEALDNNNERKFCLYPSTLRMINMSNDPSYNEMVSGVEKLLIYSLPGSDSTRSVVDDIIGVYAAEYDYEEYARIFGGPMTLSLYGSAAEDKLVGYARQEEKIFAFYLDGKIEWQKLPTLIDKLSSMEMLDIVNLNQGQKQKQETNGKPDSPPTEGTN
jgi:hypothetical protein